MEVVNGSGYPTPLHSQVAFLERQDFIGEGERHPECCYDYKRNDQGRLLEEVASDRGGKVVWRLHFTSEETAHFSDRQGMPVNRAPSGATYVHITWSPEGFEQEVRYLERNAQPAPGRDGTFGKRSGCRNQQVQRRAGVPGDGGGMPLAFEDDLQALGLRGAVLHDQDASHCASPLATGGLPGKPG
jgi:hypothetical protein